MKPRNEFYKKGDDVVVTMPSGEHKGKIIKVISKFGYGNEDQYRVKCDSFETLTSARRMRKTKIIRELYGPSDKTKMVSQKSR